MKIYSKDFRPEFKIIFDYLEFRKKILFDPIKDDLFLNTFKIKLTFKINIIEEEFETEKILMQLHSMYIEDDDHLLYIDEFLNIYIQDYDEESYSEDYSHYDVHSYNSEEPNEKLDKTLEILIGYIKEDKNYKSFKIKEKLELDLSKKQEIKKINKI